MTDGKILVHPAKPLIGLKFTYLLALRQAEDEVGKDGKRWSAYECLCDCGRVIRVTGNNLTQGRVKSCGCLNSQMVKDRNKARGEKHKNTYDLSGEYGIGYMKNGKTFFFDLEDYDLIYQYFWTDTGTYARCKRKNGDHYDYIYMHRLVFGLSDDDDRCVDHINGNPYDNRKSNLRIATTAQNSWNRKTSVKNTSGYTGVTIAKDKKKQNHAQIVVNGETINLGYYETKEEAIVARKKGEEKYYGEYVRAEENR